MIIIQYKIEPSFSAPKSYVLELINGVYRCSSKLADEKEPSIETQYESIIIENDRAAEITKKFNEIIIKGCGDGVMGCDGTFYQLSYVNGFNSWIIKWWRVIPRNWVGVDQAIELLSCQYHKTLY